MLCLLQISVVTFLLIKQHLIKVASDDIAGDVKSLNIEYMAKEESAGLCATGYWYSFLTNQCYIGIFEEWAACSCTSGCTSDDAYACGAAYNADCRGKCL